MSARKPSEAQQDLADGHAGDVCNYCNAWHPVTGAPVGPLCGKPVAKVLFWKDGRSSPSCADHGLRALTRAAKGLVLCEAEVTDAGREAVKR